MSRLTFIKILKETFKLFIEHNAEIDTSDKRKAEYEEIMKNYLKSEELDEDLLTYYQTDFLCYLFANVPYYSITKVLKEYEQYMESIFAKTNRMVTVNMISSCIYEMSPKYNRRINSEICKHISHLLQFYLFYTPEQLKDEQMIKLQMDILKKNLCDPKELFGLMHAENIQYEQQSILIEQKKTETENKKEEKVSEKVSKDNYEKAEIITSEFKKILQSLYSIKSYDAFREYVENFCEDQNRIEQAALLKDNDLSEEEKKYLDNDFARIGRNIRVFFEVFDKTIKKNVRKSQNKKRVQDKINKDISLVFKIEDW